MKKKFAYISLLILLLISISLSSCSLRIEKVNPLEVIDSGDCSAPCWRGIIPGVTTLDEAWVIAQSMLEVINSTENAPISIEKDGKGEYIIIYFDKISVTFSADSLGVVEEGDFYFHLLRELEKPTMGDLLSIYGEPESIEICHELMEMRRAIVYIYYPQMYLLFDQTLPIEGDDYSVSVNKNTHIDTILLLPRAHERPVYDFSFSWTGYGDVVIEPAKRNEGSICTELFP